MYNFAAFWEYTNQRIRYDENLISLEDYSNLSLNDLKQYPPQQCALPQTPTLRPTLTRQMERRNILRRLSSGPLLRLSKTKQRDYMESLSKWAHKKYKKWTTKPEYEDDEEWESSFSCSGEWETDSDYDDIEESPPNKQQLFDIPSIPDLPSGFKLDDKSLPVQRQRILKQSPPLKMSSPLLQHPSTGTVHQMLKGPKYGITRRISSRGKRLRKKAPDPKANIKWKGDEKKRLKVCISALMQMRFHDQLAYSGLLSSITLYMRTTLEMTSSDAAMAISIWTGLCYLTPLLSAYAADAKWGRAQTLVIAQYIFFVGMFLIAISTYFGLKYEKAAHAMFWMGMIVVGVGFGGFKPTLSPLGADQFDAKHKTDEQKRIAKENRSSFFGWLYWANQVGAIFASSVIAYICQNIDFSIGWSLACIALIFAIASYYSAKNYFICVPPEGSIFGDFLKVWCLSCRLKCKGKKPPPSDQSATSSPLKIKQLQTSSIPPIQELDEEQNSIPLIVAKDSAPDITTEEEDDDEDPVTPNQVPRLLTQDSDYLSPTKPTVMDWNKKSNGGKFDDIFIEEIKAAFGALPALIPFPVAYIIYTNLLTLVYSQGCQMNVNMGNGFVFPISSLSLISTITIIIFVPATEKFIYPSMNRYGGCCKVTPLKKMAMAFTVAIIAMLISGITEIVRKNIYIFPLDEMSSPCGTGLPVSDMSILWQSPQFFLLGMSRVLINTGAQDFFYTESPKSMKSTLFSLNYAVDGIGAMCGSLSILIVNSGSNPWITNNLNDGHLEYYFFVIGGIMCVLFGFYLVFASKYTYKEFKRIKRGKTLRGK